MWHAVPTRSCGVMNERKFFSLEHNDGQLTCRRLLTQRHNQCAAVFSLGEYKWRTIIVILCIAVCTYRVIRNHIENERKRSQEKRERNCFEYHNISYWGGGIIEHALNWTESRDQFSIKFRQSATLTKFLGCPSKYPDKPSAHWLQKKGICANRTKGNWHQLAVACPMWDLFKGTIRRALYSEPNNPQKPKKLHQSGPEAFSCCSCQDLNKTNHAKDTASAKCYVRRATFNFDPIREQKRQQRSPNRNTWNWFGNFVQRHLWICLLIFRLPRKTGRKYGM